MKTVDQADINQAAPLAGPGAGGPGSVLVAQLPRSASSPLHRPVAMAVNPKRELGVARANEEGSVLLILSASILADFRVPD